MFNFFEKPKRIYGSYRVRYNYQWYLFEIQILTRKGRYKTINKVGADFIVEDILARVPTEEQFLKAFETFKTFEREHND